MECDDIDVERDRDFHDPPSRFMSRREVCELADLLIGTDDSVEVGLSQLGIDPDEFDDHDQCALIRELEDMGVVFDEESIAWLIVV